MKSRQVNVLVVCTGNVCRSPLAQRILQDGLDRLAPDEFNVSSAGISALQGFAVTQQIKDIANHFGVGIDSHRARLLDLSSVRDIDVVLTMDRSHRRRLLERFPKLIARTFTLREFARLLPFVAPRVDLAVHPRWQAAIAAARTRRFRPDNPADDDIVDPYRRDNHVYRQMAAELVPAVRSIIAWEANARTVSTFSPRQ